jgi:hypothetical protein
VFICVHLRLILLFTLLQCPAALAASTSYPVPEGAFDVGHAAIRPGRTEQDHFSIKLAFPSTAVIDHYRGYFSRFIECRGRGAPWEAGADTSAQTPRFIHQVVRHWVTEDNREMITLAIRYISAGTEWRDRPDDDVQRVTLLYEKAFDAKRAARSQGSSCDDAPVPPRRVPRPGPLIAP